MSQSSPLFAEPLAGRYRLIRQAGSGNMSTVYEAQDLRRPNMPVAVKLLNTTHEDVLKQVIFYRETKALSRLEHPNIVRILDHGWSSSHNCHYLVLEYLPQTLLHLIERHRKDRDHAWCWPLMRQMADALMHAHGQGVIHRDVKPSNVLIDTQGIPKLVDFGISFLQFELATGMTVSSFFSVGYASPEQRRGEQATHLSDIYSLGCVFYHMLAHQAPPASGFLTPEHIEALSAPGQIKQILLRMLAKEPADRFPKMEQLRRRLEVTERIELLPEVYLMVTERARRDIFDLGYLEESSYESACAYLLQELGEDTPKAVHISQARGGDLRLSTANIRLLCARDATLPVLVVKAVEVPYQPHMEQEKSRSVSLRFLWQVMSATGPATLPRSLFPSLRNTLETLTAQVTVHQQTERATRQKGAERRDLTKVWETVLSFQQELLNAAPRLAYHSFGVDGDTLIFHLTDPAPDSHAWPSNAPVVATDPKKEREFFVGQIISSSGKTLQVSRDTGDLPPRPLDQLPPSGLLSLSQQESKAALLRQRTALSFLRDGGTSNPRLSEVLRDLSTAAFDSPDLSLVFEQTQLDEDKQRAVRQALAARDLFLLQGPPGTGKTTTLAEIILQILKMTPDARILVASQSNVAVNHILSRLAEIRGRDGLEIVRLGRAEKIGQGAQIWTLEQRLVSWREHVLRKTEPTLAQLKAREQQRRREARALQPPYDQRTMEDIRLCKDWLDEMAADIARLRQGNVGVSHARLTEIDQTLALIRESLPVEIQKPPLPTLEEEWRQLSAAVTGILEPKLPVSREKELTDLLVSWRKTFGLQEDFAGPLLERATVLAATCLTCGGAYLKDQRFDWAIIDEAGRATAPELLVPLVRARRAIIVGDERQLPPMLDDLPETDLARFGTSRAELEQSLFATLVAQGRDEQLEAVHMLTNQHRMHPAIGQLVSSVFYGGKLTHAVDAAKREHGLPWLAKPVTWFSTTQMRDHQEKEQGRSFYNRAEIRAISHLLHQMERSYRERDLHRTVAVITPYNAQIVELEAEILPTSSFWHALALEISTIDSFQGRDCDIVLYSTVRSNPRRHLGFLKDRRRLNVALSRARQALLIVGDIQTLEQGRAGAHGNPYQELIRYMRLHPADCQIEFLNVEVNHG